MELSPLSVLSAMGLNWELCPFVWSANEHEASDHRPTSFDALQSAPL